MKTFSHIMHFGSAFMTLEMSCLNSEPVLTRPKRHFATLNCRLFATGYVFFEIFFKVTESLKIESQYGVTYWWSKPLDLVQIQFKFLLWINGAAVWRELVVNKSLFIGEANLLQLLVSPDPRISKGHQECLLCLLWWIHSWDFGVSNEVEACFSLRKICLFLLKKV